MPQAIRPRWTANQIPDLTGRRIMITGATSGTGLAAAQALAGRGAEVILAVRNLQRGNEVAQRISALPGRGSARVEQLDLADLASVRALGARFSGRLDVLINNAGVMAPPQYRQTDDGYELQYQTNHLSHFLLTALLLPRLAESDAARVSTMSSFAHFSGDARVVEPTSRAGYDPARSYAQSKLANLCFALELQRRAAAASYPITSNAAHPGISYTKLFSSPDGLGSLPVIRAIAVVGPPLLRAALPSAQRGAEALLYAATTAGPGTYTGPTRVRESRGPIGPARLSSVATDPGVATALWERSEELTGATFALVPSSSRPRDTAL